jgi:DNA-binding LytR/AlgR family response regulator
MNVLIIEDEAPAANRLAKLLQQADSCIDVIDRLDSVETAVHFFHNSTVAPDLIFMDIQLADGLSFDIFEQVNIKAPVVFTTAFDQYTLKAFKVNSVDYLLKPIDETELKNALEKYRSLYPQQPEPMQDKILQLMREMNINGGKYKERLLIKRGQQMIYLKTEQLAYCYADGKLCFAVDDNGAKHLLETNLTQLEEQLSPQQFFRINRHLVVHINAVKKVHTWLGGRLKVELAIPSDADTVVSRDRVNGFKQWLGQ